MFARKRRLALAAAVCLAAVGVALGIVPTNGSANPLRTVSNHGRFVPLTTAMRKDLADSGYHAASIHLYLLARRGSVEFYRFRATGRYPDCFATRTPGDALLSSYGCARRPLGHPDRIVDGSAFEGCPMAVGAGVCPPKNICDGHPLSAVSGWAVDAVKAMRVLDESGHVAATYPVSGNVYSIPHSQLPKHACSLEAVDAHGRVLWDIHDPPEF